MRRLYLVIEALQAEEDTRSGRLYYSSWCAGTLCICRVGFESHTDERATETNSGIYA